MTNPTFTLTAANRSGAGRGASRRLRYADKVPAIVYGSGKEPQSITIDHRPLARALENEAFYSHILTLEIDGKAEQVVLKDLQRHPYKPRLVHADFQRVSSTEKLTMRIPLHFIGADIAPGVKLSGGVVSHLLSEVEVRCLPVNLPEYIDVDVSQMNLNDTLHLADIKLPEGVEIAALTHGENKPVITVYIPRSIVETVGGESAPVTVVAGATAESEAAEAGKSVKGGGESSGKKDK